MLKKNLMKERVLILSLQRSLIQNASASALVESLNKYAVIIHICVICTHTHTYTHIHIYIHIYVQKRVRQDMRNTHNAK